MTDLTALSATAVVAELRARRVSPLEVLDAAITRIDVITARLIINNYSATAAFYH